MKIKTGLWAIGLFTLTSAAVINCGGSSSGDDDDSASGKAGQSGVAGGTGTAGTPAGTSGSPAGTSGSPAGTAGNGTSGSPAGTAGNQNAGGDDPGPGPGAGGDGPAMNGCPTAAPTDGAVCTSMSRQPCVFGTNVCTCRRMGNGQNAMRAWDCNEVNVGQGGDNGGGGFEATCPAMAKTGDACTGTGICTGQQCGCFNMKVTCR